MKFFFNGQEVEAREGETIAMALYAAGIRDLSKSQKFHRPRGLFCAIGKCSSCLLTVDGIPNVRTCIIPVKEGMRVEASEGNPRLADNVPPPKKFMEPETHRTDLLVIGGGPAGLQAAIHAADMGARVTVLDEAPMLGG